MAGEPQVNEVWRTHEGNLVLIVNDFRIPGYPLDPTGDELQKLKMLWYDKVDKTFNTSELLSRLKYRVELSPTQWFEEQLQVAALPFSHFPNEDNPSQE